MDTDEEQVVLSTSIKSSLSISLHPLPILNISEHLTRLKLQTRKVHPFVLGALLGTQNGRDVEIVNTFELAVDDPPTPAAGSTPSTRVDHGFLTARREQYKQVFPSLDFIGWYTVAPHLTATHLELHSEFIQYNPTPILLVLSQAIYSNTEGGLPFKTYEPILEIRDRQSHSVYVEAAWKIETGEAERIAVDWTARGGASDGGGNTLITHLQTQRSAIKMLHERILVLVDYVTRLVAGSAKKDYEILRSLTALVASLPASESPYFREEFETERADVLLTTYLSTLTKTQNTLNDIVDKYLIMSSGNNDRDGGGPSGRGKRRGITIGESSFGMRGLRGMGAYD